jgi:glycosyltransferase involved in cell wall biosynthesis
MKRPLNIALLGTRGIPNTYGGFEQCAEFLSQGLVKKGHQVSVYCSSNDSHREDSWNNVNLVYCNDPEQLLGTSGQFIYDLNCILHARKQHYDIVVQFGYTSSSIWRWFWPKGAKHLVNMDGLEFLRTKYSLATKLFLRNAEKWAASRADMLIADNVGIEKYLKSKYPKSDIRCITYGAKTPMLLQKSR